MTGAAPQAEHEPEHVPEHAPDSRWADLIRGQYAPYTALVLLGSLLHALQILIIARHHADHRGRFGRGRISTSGRR